MRKYRVPALQRIERKPSPTVINNSTNIMPTRKKVSGCEIINNQIHNYYKSGISSATLCIGMKMMELRILIARVQTKVRTDTSSLDWSISPDLCWLKFYARTAIH